MKFLHQLMSLVCLWKNHHDLYDLTDLGRGVVRLKCLRCGRVTVGWKASAFKPHVKVRNVPSQTS